MQMSMLNAMFVVLLGNFFYLSIQNGDTPLHKAVRGGHTNCIQILLEAGAIPTLRNEVTVIQYRISVLRGWTHPL
jgi:ankyrin repeat protein